MQIGKGEIADQSAKPDRDMKPGDANFGRPAASGAKFTYGASVLQIKDGIWHLRVRESGYRESGRAIGHLLAAAQYPAVGFFRKKTTRALVGLLHGITRGQFSAIRIPERYLDELRGYAESSGIAFNTLFFMNFVFDVLKKYGFHCSSVAIANERIAIVGRNTDLIPWIAKAALKLFPPVLLDILVPGTLRYVHLTPGLFLGVFSGFNDQGVAMMSHQIAATREKAVHGSLATPLLQRIILEEAATIADADRIIRENPIQRCVSNLITSSSECMSKVYEITPQAVKSTSSRNSYLCCATHFSDNELSGLHRQKITASQRRLSLMNALAETVRGQPHEIIAVLKNSDNGIDHRSSGLSPTNLGTYQSAVFDVTGRRVLISDGTKLPVSLTGVYRDIAIDAD